MAFSPDQTSDLWLKIDQHHLNYLKSEDNTNKIEIRKKLEGFIHQYLCMVPQDRKFCNSLTSDILFESARFVADFSALKAARAFEAIEKYCANLMNQPWRKEFREIKQYGGFYKHQVESFLYNPERMFHMMGYSSTPHQTLVLEGQVEVDKVTVTARDCVLAFVECQIIVSILQGVTAHFPCRWDEVLEFRRAHIGSAEQATRALVYQKNQLQFAQKFGHPYAAGGYPYMPACYLPMANVPTGNLIGMVGPANPAKPNIHGDDVTGSSGSSSASTATWGQRGPIPLTIKQLEDDDKKGKTASSRMRENQQPLDSWDYVFRQLESIGYTKDQADRPDVLEFLAKVALPAHLEKRLREGAAQPSAAINNNGAGVNVNGNDDDHESPPPPRRPAKPRYECRYEAAKGPTPEAYGRYFSPENSSTPSPPPPRLPEKKSCVPALPPKLPEKKRLGRQPSSGDETEPEVEQWECHACTFLNSFDVEICRMCSKSRRNCASDADDNYDDEDSRYGDARQVSTENDVDAEDLSAGNSQISCPKCTFFNTGDVEICIVCGASLYKEPIKVERVRKRPGSSRSNR